MRAAVGFGANLGQREKTILKAAELLSSRIGPLRVISELIETKALVLPGDDTDVPKYLNAVALYESKLSPKELFEQLRVVETQLGRTRELETKRWAARVIDLDLLALEDQTYRDNELLVPHAEMHKRDFVLIPFRQVWPEWIHPIFNESIETLLARARSAD